MRFFFSSAVSSYNINAHCNTHDLLYFDCFVSLSLFHPLSILFFYFGANKHGLANKALNACKPRQNIFIAERDKMGS